jgi:hypothetical protein
MLPDIDVISKAVLQMPNYFEEKRNRCKMTLRFAVSLEN